ncbi:MAG: hypothetical protein Q4G03_09060 [Planctomycetia bacterium]|nr:hypothetical protein [Planctomycetia bacterium]
MKIVAVLDGRNYPMTPYQFREFVRRGLITRETTLFLNDEPISYHALIQALKEPPTPPTTPATTTPPADATHVVTPSAASTHERLATSSSDYSAPKPSTNISSKEPSRETIALKERHATLEAYRKREKRHQAIVMGILVSFFVCVVGVTALLFVAHLLGFNVGKDINDQRASAGASDLSADNVGATSRRRPSVHLDQELDRAPESPSSSEPTEPLFGDVFDNDDPQSRRPIPQAPTEEPESKKSSSSTSVKVASQDEQKSVLPPSKTAVADKQVAPEPSVSDSDFAVTDPASGQFLLDPFDVRVKQLPPHFRGHDAERIVTESKNCTLFAELAQKKTETDKAYEKRLNKLMRELSNATIYGNLTYGSVLAFEVKVAKVDYDPEKNMASTTLEATISTDKHGLVLFETGQKASLDKVARQIRLVPLMPERGRVLHMDKVNRSAFEKIESRVRAICIAKLYAYPTAPYIYVNTSRSDCRLYLTEPTFWLYDEQTGSILQRFTAQEIMGGFAKPIMPLREPYEAIEPNGFHVKPRGKETSHDDLAADLFVSSTSLSRMSP